MMHKAFQDTYGLVYQIQQTAYQASGPKNIGVVDLWN